MKRTPTVYRYGWAAELRRPTGTACGTVNATSPTQAVELATEWLKARPSRVYKMIVERITR